ncbi:MAG TPA: alpha/beta hydrolase [Terriglobales bacterium]|nr:alpha/beta hydrolase [Terriglobales bacterium]
MSGPGRGAPDAVRLARPLAAGRGRLVYERLGSGPDVIFLHGLLGCAAQWHAAAAGLAGRHTCWLLELPGISASTGGGRANYALAGLSAWLEQAVEALALEGFDLVGSSWGGAIALAFAAGATGRGALRRLALVAPAHPLWTPNRGQRLMLRPLAARAGAWLGAHASPDIHRQLLARCYGDPARLAAAAVADYTAVLHQRGLGAAVGGYGRHWRRDHAWLRAQLAAITAPTLLLWGERDAVVPAASAPALRDALPGARLEVLAGLGHLPFAEDPAAFDRALGPFLAGQ